MGYSVKEQEILNKQLERWKKMQLTAVSKGNKIDNAFEKMIDIERAVWEQVAKATTYKDVSVGAWELADKVIRKYCKLAK